MSKFEKLVRNGPIYNPNWLKIFINRNKSPSKNPDIKTPLVMSILLNVFIHFSTLVAPRLAC